MYALHDAWDHARGFVRDRAVRDPEPSTRAAVLQFLTLGFSSQYEDLAFVQERAVRDPDPQTRAMAIEALTYGTWGKLDLLPFLQNRVVNEPEPGVRRAAFGAAESLIARLVPWEYAAASHRTREAANALIRLAGRHPDEAIRAKAAKMASLLAYSAGG